jgi:hypothetical protein
VNGLISNVNFKPKSLWEWLTNKWSHAAYWLFYIGIEISVRFLFDMDFLPLIQIGINILFLMVFFYTCSLYIIPKFLKDSMWEAFSFLILFFLVHCSLKFLLGSFLDFQLNMKNILIDEAFMAIHFIPIAGGYWYARLSYRIEIEKENYLKEKYKAEMKLSKSLLGPHFLFNYLMGIQEDIMLNTSNYIKCIPKLSNLIQYGLRHVDHSSDWNKETKALEAFIKLNLVRFSDEFYLEFQDDISSKSKKSLKMPALITINIVDNIFKYANYKDPSNPVRIFLRENVIDENKRIMFSVQNKITHRLLPNSLGIGLATCRKILKIEFGNNAKLIYMVHEDVFTLELTIDYGDQRI